MLYSYITFFQVNFTNPPAVTCWEAIIEDKALLVTLFFLTNSHVWCSRNQANPYGCIWKITFVHVLPDCKIAFGCGNRLLFIYLFAYACIQS